jgi:hypothetical protein
MGQLEQLRSGRKPLYPLQSLDAQTLIHIQRDQCPRSDMTGSRLRIMVIMDHHASAIIWTDALPISVALRIQSVPKYWKVENVR